MRSRPRRFATRWATCRSPRRRAFSAISATAAAWSSWRSACSAMEHGVVPPTLNYETPDPECPVNVVTEIDADRPARVRQAEPQHDGPGGGGGDCGAVAMTVATEARRAQERRRCKGDTRASRHCQHFSSDHLLSSPCLRASVVNLPPHRPVDVALRVAFFDRLAFVVLLLAVADAEQHFRPALL